MSEFSSWFAEYDSEVEHEHMHAAEDAAKSAWNHQQAEIELLKSQAKYHFESQREDYNRLEDALVENEDLKAEIEQLKAKLATSHRVSPAEIKRIKNGGGE